ncbi:MAG: hypothetical protein JWR83_3464 [Aeromicrobium sp.]|nr:hypothetical protein [Aeromicrobium sp.]
MRGPVGNEWSELPLMLKVEEAAGVLRIGRSKAYEMTTLYATTAGTDGLPSLRLGDLLRVPRFALEALVTTGRVVQLIPTADTETGGRSKTSAKSTRPSPTADHTQLSLLTSD